jgi:1-acyl-sn-glycerol-3-phosphate acyltransferase
VGHLRATLRAVLLAAFSLVLAVPTLLLSALLRMLGARGERTALRAVSGLQQAWCAGALAILSVRVVTRGTPPAGACVIAGNHLSYLDPAVLGAALRCRFVAKSEVADWPGFGWLARLARVVFLRREQRRDLLRAGDEIRRSLGAGVSVAFFPEGTSTRGAEVRPFHPGLLQPAAEAGLPCLPVALRYETPAGHPAPSLGVCWWGDMTFGPHFWRLLMLPWVRAEVAWGAAPLRAADRKTLAAALQHEVASLFVPVRQETGAAPAASDPAPLAASR